MLRLSRAQQLTDRARLTFRLVIIAVAMAAEKDDSTSSRRQKTSGLAVGGGESSKDNGRCRGQADLLDCELTASSAPTPFPLRLSPMQVTHAGNSHCKVDGDDRGSRQQARQPGCPAPLSGQQEWACGGERQCGEHNCER